MTVSRLNQTFCTKGPEWLIVTYNRAAFFKTPLGKEIKSRQHDKKKEKKNSSMGVWLSTPDSYHAPGETDQSQVQGMRTCHWQFSDHTHYATTHNAPATTIAMIQHHASSVPTICIWEANTFSLSGYLFSRFSSFQGLNPILKSANDKVMKASKTIQYQSSVEILTAHFKYAPTT